MAEVKAIMDMVTKSANSNVTPQPADRVIVVRGAESTSSVTVTTSATAKVN